MTISRAMLSTSSHRADFGQSHLKVCTSNGLVTVTGIVQYAHQKIGAMKAIAGMTGIRRVVSQVTVKPAARRT